MGVLVCTGHSNNSIKLKTKHVFDMESLCYAYISKVVGAYKFSNPKGLPIQR